MPYKVSTWNLFDPSSKQPYKLSRSKIDMFTECPRCFYLDRRFGVGRPQGPSFTLNSAVDELFKREFDIHREAQTRPAILERFGIDAVPLKDDRMDEWRDALKRGISAYHKDTNLEIRGGIDDVWVLPTNEIVIADYKATSKKEGPKTEDDLYDSYKKQIEIYQWLFRQNGFTVSPTSYFVYANGKSDMPVFDAKLEFDIEIIPYVGNDDWIEPTLKRLKDVLIADEIPPIGTAFGGGPCDFCTYRDAAGKTIRDVVTKAKKKADEKEKPAKLF